MQRQILCGELIIQTVRRSNFCFCYKVMFLNLEEQNKVTEVLIRAEVELCVWFDFCDLVFFSKL
jgi:hypothetical protein